MSDPRTTDWTAGRRALAWGNVALQAVLLLGLLVVVNLIARGSPKRFDLTQRRSYHLSDQTEDTLKNLSYDVEMWLTSPLYAATEDKSLPVAMQRTQDLLEEFKGRTKRLTVNYVGANERDVPLRFRQNWNLMTPATLYILTTLGTARTNKKAIEIQQLYEGNLSSGEVTAYRGEPMIIGAIRELGAKVKHVVYESAGHQELMTANKMQLGIFHKFLSENEGIEFKQIPLLSFKSVPSDCELLMIMGPTDPFDAHELEVIRDYIERGGSLLVAVRPRKPTGLEKLLKEYSVSVGENFIYDSANYVPPLMTNLAVSDFSVHDINRSMVNLKILVPECCAVDTVPRKDATWRIVPLARSGKESSWESNIVPGPDSRPTRKKDDRGGPLSLIVVVDKPATTDPEHKRAKIDVWGSVMPFANDALRAGGQTQVEYVINHVRWLMDRSLLTIVPEKISVKPLLLSDDQISQLKWIVLLGFPCFGVALGLLAWFVRRK